MKLQCEADALLFLESPATQGREGVLTGKLFEYLAARKPVLAIGIHHGSLAADILVESDAGIIVNRDEALINSFIQELEEARLTISPRGLPLRFDRATIAMELLKVLEDKSKPSN